MNKTNAVRLIEANKIHYEIRSYPVDENDLSGKTVAEKIGAAEETVFKTLTAKGDKTGIVIFCIPVNFELNLKKAAAISGNKKIELVPLKDLFNITGYVRGGCSPIGMKRKYPTFIDDTAQLFDQIFISAGIRGMQVGVHPKDLQILTEAIFADLT